jgi:exonuclease SbcD
MMTPARKTVRILHTADTHLGFDFPVRPRVKRRRRGDDFFRNFRSILDHAAADRVDMVVHGGDFFFRSRVPQKIVDLAYGVLFEWARHGIPIVIVPGNHERSILPVSLYLQHPNIYVFDRPRTIDFELNGVTVALSGFPFERHDIRTRFGKVLETTGWRNGKGDVRLLCVHQTFEGASVGPSGYTFRASHDVIRPSDVPPQFSAVLAGHIHRKQILGDRTNDTRRMPPVLYPGSIERTSFAEKDEDKGYFDITIRRGDNGDWSAGEPRFCPLPARPMEDIVIDGDLPAGKLDGFLRARIAEIAPDSIVRLKPRGQVSHALRKRMSVNFVRALFPDTMNVQFAAGFHPSRNRKQD